MLSDKLKRRFRLMKEEELTFDNVLKEALQEELVDKDIEERTIIEELSYLKKGKRNWQDNSKTYRGAQWNTRK